MTQVVDARNYVQWNSWWQAQRYRKRAELIGAEEAIFNTLLSAPVERILDLGVGAGRTTAYIADRAQHYIGIDYAPTMVKAARGRFPGCDLRVGDACDLAGYADDSMDFVLFSFNGIDSLSHSKRLQAFAEARRVLKPTGHFCFSTHNRDYDLPPAGSLRRIYPTRHPIKYLKRAALDYLGMYRYHGLKRFERGNEDHCIKVDAANYYGRLQYYIGVGKQREQLASAGFCAIAAYGRLGERLDLDAPYRGDFMFYVTARKCNG